MLNNQPFLIENVEELRQKIQRLEASGGKQAELWNLIKSSARSSPLGFGWFTPFVALMMQDEKDIENARRVIFTYIDKLDPMSFCSGLQYHFWCFAFPHAKICMYFQWLCTMGAFSEDEIEFISQRLINYHFVNFYYGMRSKPDPECVDNQTLSLCLSNTIVGYIFAHGENSSKMAEIMLRDGKRRLPAVIGDMPVSGYSGEGSSYMDCVNGPAVPLAVEVLERITREKKLLFKKMGPHGAAPVNILRMVAREFMPGGLLLPWDNYGYQFGVRSALAYGAIKTGEDLFFRVLEKECIWTYDIGIGWAYDDLVWTLIWWPESRKYDPAGGANWFEPATGGTLVSSDQNHYVIQMWDESTPVIPTRAHVNPNALIFNAYGYPISADGSPMPEKPHSFQFDDTWRRVGFLSINTESRYNYGDGCVGAHSCIIVDNNEGMRAFKEYQQYRSSSYGEKEHWVYCDVTPIYQENFSDIHLVARKTSLIADRFFVIEDCVVSEEPHDITSRFLFRPNVTMISGGFSVHTPEGITFEIRELMNQNRQCLRYIENHPFKPDGCSQAADFTGRGKEVRRLFVASASRTIKPVLEITDLTAIPDPECSYSFAQAAGHLAESSLVLPMKLPAYMEAPVENHHRWWYKKVIDKPAGQFYLQLPKGMWKPQLYLDGEEMDLSEFSISQELLPPHILLPQRYYAACSIEVVLRVDVPVGHYDGGGDGTIGMTGGMWLCMPVESEPLKKASYDGETLTVQIGDTLYRQEYRLLDGKGLAE